MDYYEIEEEDGKDEEVENINNLNMTDSQSDSASKSHSVSVYSPLYIYLDSSDKSDWQLLPRKFSKFCTECYGRILEDRNSYQNVCFRVRLVRNVTEILLETVRTGLLDRHLIGVGPSSTSTKPSISMDEANKVDIIRETDPD